MKSLTALMAKNLLEQTQEDALIFGDGHAIYPVAEYKKWDVDNIVSEKEWESLEETYESGDDYKSTIYSHDTGERMDELTGVWNLTFLFFFCAQLGVSTSTMVYGRGTEARILAGRIYDKLREIASWEYPEYKKEEEE